MAIVERYLPPRNSQLWLLVSLALVLLPFIQHLPLWLVVVWAVVVLWRWQLFYGRWSAPGNWIKVVLVGLSFVGLGLSFGQFQGLESMTSLLILALLLKWLEQQRLRDTLLLVYLGYFLVGVQFLYEQSLVMTLYALLCLWGLSSALISLYQPQGHAQPKSAAKLSGKLLLQSIPLMLLLFLIMPRLGNLWALPSPGGNAKTGMSDSMSPGDFSKLSKSGGVAFRVSFNGRRPPQEALYWRGPVLSLFNGRQWVQSFAAQNISRFSGSRQVVWPSHGQSLRSDPFAPAWLVASKANSLPVEYTITLEPTYQTWLFSLPLVNSLQVNTQGQDMNLGVTRDFRLTSSKPINQRLIYTLRSSTDFYINAKGLSQQERKRGLQLPANYNPQTRANAQQWRETSASDEDYIERVLEHYRQTFIYTLEPPKLGKHTVDEFLWQQQQGFCEHFASSFVVMMRAAGIPARVVTGYQGGEYNAADNYLVIHQYDAHAWTEVWLPGKGWVRIDPTAAVAPERVQQSLGDLQTEGVEGLLSLGRYRHLRLVAQLRQEWDAVNYRWHQLVIGFDGEEQKRFLWSLIGDVSPLKIILLLLGVATTVLGLISLHLWWRNRPEPLNPIDRYFLRFEQLLARRGVSREVGEAPNHFADKAKQTLPKSANAIDNFMLIFNQAQYQQPPIKVRKGFVIAESRILMELRKALKVFRKSTR